MDDRFNWRQLAAVENRHRRRRVSLLTVCRSLRRSRLVIGGRGTVARPRLGVEQAAPGAVLALWGNVGTTTPQTEVDVGEQSISLGADVDELLVGGQLHSPDTLGIRTDSLHRQMVTRLHRQSLHAQIAIQTPVKPFQRSEK